MNVTYLFINICKIDCFGCSSDKTLSYLCPKPTVNDKTG